MSHFADEETIALIAKLQATVQEQAAEIERLKEEPSSAGITREQVVQWAKQAWDDTGEGWTNSRWFDERAPSFEAFATLARADMEATIAQQAEALDQLKAMLVRLDGWLADRNLCGLMPDELAVLAIQPTPDILRERDARLVRRIAEIEHVFITPIVLLKIADKIEKGEWK